MTMTEAAVVETGGAPFTLSQIELSDPRPDEVLVRMVAAGLCHTDLGVASGGSAVPASRRARARGRRCRRGGRLVGDPGQAGRPGAAVVHLVR